jgi:hypothetical protein
MHFDDRYRYDAAMIDAEDAVADPKSGNGSIAVLGRDRRIG